MINKVTQFATPATMISTSRNENITSAKQKLTE